MLAFYGIYMFCGCKITRFHLKNGWYGVTNNSATEYERQIRAFLQAWVVGWGGGMGNAGEIKINLKGKMPSHLAVILEKENWQFLICHPRFLKCRQRGGDAVLYT